MYVQCTRPACLVHVLKWKFENDDIYHVWNKRSTFCVKTKQFSFLLILIGEFALNIFPYFKSYFNTLDFESSIFAFKGTTTASKWNGPFFISYFDNARLIGDKHHNPRNWVFPTLSVKNFVRNGLHIDHYDNVDHYDNTFKSQI